MYAGTVCTGVKTKHYSLPFVSPELTSGRQSIVQHQSKKTEHKEYIFYVETSASMQRITSSVFPGVEPCLIGKLCKSLSGRK